ncbi:hypothetical protein H6G89_02695 [Oscillatoria sp. FACHB-1407]|uniref:type IV pilin-like G/H family protein n=1 Tax=Oscillatoria sp. FACHB-1407 TaxID=2692847 RepID=UPI001682BC7D|nr:type IV pilin-like G/H family protein [Oscillatoria sp. FACHB-1407]MBD2459944.1 hypothetical protein [Oscillatoria sp. FACHB-1407]
MATLRKHFFSTSSSTQRGIILWRLIVIFVVLLMIAIYMQWMLINAPVQTNFNMQARGMVFSLTRFQEYYFKNHQRFADSTQAFQDEFQIDVIPGANVYHYSIRTTPQLTLIYGIPHAYPVKVRRQFSGFTWYEKVSRDRLQSYVGAVVAQPTADDSYKVSSIVCETEFGQLPHTTPHLQNGELTCGSGTTPYRR